MGKKSYKLGSVSEILSKNSAASTDLDPKLCDIFANSAFKSKPQTTPTVDATTVKSEIVKGRKSDIKRSNGAKSKVGKLSHKDAAAIRVEAKRKFQDTQAAEGDSVKQEDAPQKKKKRLGKISLGMSANEDTEVTPATEDKKLAKKLAKKLKKQAKKAAVNGGTEAQLQPKSEDTEGTPATEDKKLAKKLAQKLKKKEKAAVNGGTQAQPSKKYIKKLIQNKKAKNASSDEEDDEEDLSKIPDDMENTIAEFEREQLDSEDEDSEDENGSVKNEESKPKKLKHFELNTPKDKKPEHESRTVFVGNLPTNTKENTLKQLFKPFGEIETLRFRGAVPLKPYLLKKAAMYSHKLNPDQYNICGYIRFKTKEQAEKAAAEMNGHTLDRHNLVVDIADNKKKDNKRAVFVGNIPLKVEDDQLRKFFSECGKIESVRIIRDATTGLSKGFGYVNFEQPDSIELAIQKSGEEFEGRSLRVARHVKKEKKTKDQNNQKVKGSKFLGGKFGPAGKKDFQGKKSGAARRIELKKFQDSASFTGDKLAEAGTLKKKANKPNKGEMRKAKIAAQLTGLSTKQSKKNQQKGAKRK